MNVSKCFKIFKNVLLFYYCYKTNFIKNILLVIKIYLTFHKHPSFLIEHNLFLFLSINYRILLFVVPLFLIINVLLYFKIVRYVKYPETKSDSCLEKSK